MTAVLVRVILVALAACAVVVGAHSLRADHRCGQAKVRALTTPRARLGGVAGAALARCGDPRDRALVSFVLSNRGRRDAAVRIARAMTVAVPEDYIGWLTLYRLTGDRRALVRAHHLNPRGTLAP